jgi:hypothetical protein
MVGALRGRVRGLVLASLSGLEPVAKTETQSETQSESWTAGCECECECDWKWVGEGEEGEGKGETGGEVVLLGRGADTSEHSHMHSHEHSHCHSHCHWQWKWHWPSIVALLRRCFERGAKVLLPRELSRFTPVVSAAYHISIVPLRIVTWTQGAPVEPLPFSLAPSSTGPLRVLDDAAVRVIIQQLNPLCRLLEPPKEVYPSAGATWLGLYSTSISASSFADPEPLSVIQAAVGVSVSGHVWVHRSPQYLDWKKIAAVIQATLTYSNVDGESTRVPRLVSVLHASDDCTAQAMLSPYCGFTTPIPEPSESGGTMCLSGLVDLICFRGDIARLLPPASDTAENHKPNLLFLLAGQSNMSGRGRHSDLVQEHSLIAVRESLGIKVDDSDESSPFALDCSVSPPGVHLTPRYSRRVASYDVKDSEWKDL